MAEIKLGKYRILAPTMNQNGELKHKGDEIMLSTNQAIELRGMVEPVDDEAKAVVTLIDTAPDLTAMRPHEREPILKERRERLASELAKVDAELASISSTTKAPAAKPVKDTVVAAEPK
jgi:hypothetical protein